MGDRELQARWAEITAARLLVLAGPRKLSAGEKFLATCSFFLSKRPVFLSEVEKLGSGPGPVNVRPQSRPRFPHLLIEERWSR